MTSIRSHALRPVLPPAPEAAAASSPLPIDEEQQEHLSECCVCQESEAPDADNPLVYCDVCNCGVHAQCYGYPLSIDIPSAEWICQSCLASASLSAGCAPIVCCLCPSQQPSAGLLKRTTTSEWAHLSCALWIPEVFFRVPDGVEAIDCCQLSAERRGRRCLYCGSDAGACSECSEKQSCGCWYHVTCGMRRGVLLEYRQGRGDGDAVIISYCHTHARKWKKQGRAALRKRSGG